MKTGSEWEAPPHVPDDHYVDSAIYTDPTILAEERKRIFETSWKLACHESEMPNPGDFRVTDVAGVSVVLVRGEDSVVRAFVNACPHRGAPLVRKPRGNAKALSCFFHLWTFDTKGACRSITRPEGYEEVGFDKTGCGLRTVRVAQKLGLYFVTLDDSADDFHEHIGNTLEGMEESMGTVPLEVFHLHHSIVKANWKQWHETNMETYHEWGHVVNRQTGIAAEGYFERTWQIHKEGHGSMAPLQVKYENYKGFDARVSLELPGLKPGGFLFADLFPNTTIIVRATNIRIDTSTPIAPGLTMVEHRGLGIKGEPAAQRAERRKHHNQLWGPLGRNLPEDLIFVEAVHKSYLHGASRYGLFARRENLRGQDDEIIRGYYRAWNEKMGRKANDPFGRRSHAAAQPALQLVAHGAD